MLEIEIRMRKRGCLVVILSTLLTLGIGCYLLFHEGIFLAILPAMEGGIFGAVLIPACIAKFKELNAELDNLHRNPWLKSETETPEIYIEKIYVIGIILGEALLFPIVWINSLIGTLGFIAGIFLYLYSTLAYYGY